MFRLKHQGTTSDGTWLRSVNEGQKLTMPFHEFRDRSIRDVSECCQSGKKMYAHKPYINRKTHGQAIAGKGTVAPFEEYECCDRTHCDLDAEKGPIADIKQACHQLITLCRDPGSYPYDRQKG